MVVTFAGGSMSSGLGAVVTRASTEVVSQTGALSSAVAQVGTQISMAAAHGNNNYSEKESKKNSGADNIQDINIKEFEIKNKHLSSSTAKRARKFNVSTAEEANNIVQDSLKNGKLVKTLLNKLGTQGQNSFSSIIDSGKVIGTKGETHIKIVFDELKNVWTTYPVPKP